ncbi:MAG: type II toxin-antitoxin system RelE/ParE family toxin [Flavonifractor plautii]
MAGDHRLSEHRFSPETALRYYDKLTEEIGGLSHMPERCPRPRDLALAAKGYRYLIVENYLVFYAISGQTVQDPAHPPCRRGRNYRKRFYSEDGGGRERDCVPGRLLSPVME